MLAMADSFNTLNTFDKYVMTDNNEYIPYVNTLVEKLMLKWLSHHNFTFNKYICCYLLHQLQKLNIKEDEHIQSVMNVYMISLLPSVLSYFDNTAVGDDKNYSNIPESLYRDYKIVLSKK